MPRRMLLHRLLGCLRLLSLLNLFWLNHLHRLDLLSLLSHGLYSYSLLLGDFWCLVFHDLVLLRQKLIFVERFVLVVVGLDHGCCVHFVLFFIRHGVDLGWNLHIHVGK